MQIIGFNFNKINIERKQSHKGNVNISNNVAIKSIDIKDIDLSDKKKQALNFQFEFTSKYTPELASLVIQGEVISVDDQKKSKDILTKWSKDKKIDPEIIAPVLNAALNKCNIKALELSDDFNLPPPVPLPRVNIERGKSGGEQKNYIG